MSEPTITFTVVFVLAFATLIWLFFTLVKHLESSIRERAEAELEKAEAIAAGEQVAAPLYAADLPGSAGPLSEPAPDDVKKEEN